jgi:hypothetical protein
MPRGEGRRTAISADVPPGTSHLTVKVPARVSRGRALALLDAPGRAGWLGELIELRADDADRHLVDLELRVSEQTPHIAFRKAAYVDVGPVRDDRFGPIRLAISWRAAGLAPLFPVFSGTLAWDAGELQLDGYYAPPGGGIGIIADRLLLNVAARGTARLLLERVASAMRGDRG